MRHRRAMTWALASACSLAYAGEPAPSPPVTTHAEATPDSDAAVNDILREALQKHPEIQRAYLVRRPDTTQVFLIPIFDNAPGQAALDSAVEVYAKAFPDEPPLGIVLLAKRTWKRETAGLQPIYVRPRLP